MWIISGKGRNELRGVIGVDAEMNLGMDLEMDVQVDVETNVVVAFGMDPEIYVEMDLGMNFRKEGD